MKKLVRILTFSFALLASMATMAQDNRDWKADHPGKHKGHAKKAMKELNLSLEQKKKMRQLHMETANRRDEIKANQTLSEDQKRAQLKQLQEQRQADVQAVLNAEQRAKLEQLKQQAKERRKQGKQGRRNGDEVERREGRDQRAQGRRK